MNAAIEIHGAGVTFGDIHALADVTLRIEPGEVVGLLGPNGAGKTTLVRAIATLQQLDSGEITVEGHTVAAAASDVRAHIGLAGQHAALDELLTGRENLELVGRLYGLDRTAARRRAGELLTAVDLVDAGRRRVGTYSGGMRRRLDLGATLIGNPAVLLLDEPTVGLDPRIRDEIWDLIDAIAARGTTILLTSQHLDEVDRLAKRIIVLDHGRLVADGTPAELKAQAGGELHTVFFALTDAPSATSDDRPATPCLDALRPFDASERNGTFAADVAAATGRSWKRKLRTPQVLYFAAFQPLFFIVFIKAVFGRLVEPVIGGHYIQYVVPGAVVMNIALSAGATGVGLADDMKAGIIDRFRSLPMARSAVLVARTVTDTLAIAFATFAMVAVGAAEGFRPHNGALPFVAAVLLALLFGHALTWVFAAVGLAVDTPEAAQFAGFTPVLPLVFLSSIWLPLATMDEPLRSFARHQPVNVTAEAVRSLCNGPVAWSQAFQSLGWSALLIAVFATIATRSYAKP